MTKKVRQRLEGEYSQWLGREWSRTKGGGCFTLLYDMGKDIGYHTCKEDYSFTAREFLKDLWEAEDWSVLKTSEMGEVFDLDDLNKFDILVMKLDKRLNHCAVYLGEGYLLHHKAFDQSRIESVEQYIPKTLYVIRKNA
jgi:hypothetical protein|tara:strand:+ start:994 stop:1410 length:417 start_codon:yes stop_codon:yes gene_type:complete